jgi:soluble lytic murein transglycosylase
MERWGEAATLLDALPEVERDRPEIKYVRARAALATKDSGRAVTLLAGLEQKLPAIADDIARFRAEAALEAGPFGEAGAYFARGTKARDFLRSAEAYEKAGDAANARLMVDKAVTAAQRAKSKRDEAAAHALRVKLLAPTSGSAATLDPVAAGDLRWLAISMAAAPEGRAAAEALERAKQPLTMKERIRAVEEMLEAGAAADALAEVEKLTAIPGAPKRELQHLKASALYKSRSFLDAAKAYQLAALGRSGREAEQLTLSARALARGGKDAEAIKRYAEVAARYKATPYGEVAAYQVARLMLQNGRFKEAEAAFTKYLAAFPQGKDRDDAEVERALALLSGGSAAQARKTFGLLAQKAKADAAGKLRELEGLAALRAGDRPGAVKVWTEVVKSHPLSWASLSARSRLLMLGAEVPPLLPASAAAAAKAAQAAPDAVLAPLPVSLPPTPAFLFSLGLDGDAEVRLASNEPEAAAAYAGRESEALCAMYGMLSRAKRRYRVGSAAVSYATLMRAPAPSERWAWDCIYPRPYAEPVRALEEQYGLPKGILYALMRQESAFDPAAKSPADAVGLMQLIPPTATRVAAELSMPYDPAALTSPEVSLRLGAYYFAKLLKMFQGSVTLAAAAYNAGPIAVSHWLETGADNDADVWVARIPYDETRNYVARVAGNLSRYQWLEGGDAAVTVLPLEIPVSARAPADAY